ncbi:MAG: M56 family metallopeptidase [Clostridia bacterium]
MLDTLFLQILNMSFTASFVIAFVLLIRLVLQKTSKIFSYALWSVVLFRLVCPFSFESVFSILPTKANPVPTNIGFMQAPQIDTGIPIINDSINAILPEAAPVVSINPLQIWIFSGQILWLLGIAILLIYSLVTLYKLTRKLKGATLLRDHIFLLDNISTAFVLGMVRPKIYLPLSLNNKEQDYILLHEQTHIKRLDHIVKILAFLVLCVHWFNPFVWVAFFAFSKDMELSCDEAVIKTLGNEVKKDYSASLLSIATGKRIVGGTPLAFGEGDTKSRIQNVLNYKKPAFWVIVVTTIAVVAVGIGLAANPKEKPAELGAAQTLWNARTEYVGNNAAVGKILGLLQFPDRLIYQFFALQTDGDARGVELHFLQDTNEALGPEVTWQMDKNAILLFALIGNLEDVRCSVVDKDGGSVVLHQTRAWADKVVDGDVRDYGESAEKLQELLQLTAAAAPKERRTKAPLNDMRPMIMVDGVLYLDTGKEVAKNVDNSAIIGEITSAAFVSEKPTENGQCNFNSGVGAKYAAYEDGMAVFLNNKWFFFGKEATLSSDFPIPEFGTKISETVNPEKGYEALSLRDVTREQAESYIKELRDSGWTAVDDFSQETTVGGLYEKGGKAVSVQFAGDLFEIYFSETAHSPDNTAPAAYTMMKLGKNGSLLSSYLLKNNELADAILFDALSKSAAWEGVDVSTLEECYLIRKTLPETGEVHDYYAYRLKEATAALPSDTAVLQGGADGRYSVLSAELYTQLVDSFNS